MQKVYNGRIIIHNCVGSVNLLVDSIKQTYLNYLNKGLFYNLYVNKYLMNNFEYYKCNS